MRFDHQKAFPYPVLRPDVDDYVEGEFQVTVVFESEERSSKIKIMLDIAISVDEIVNHIRNKNAVYVAVVACRETYYRETFKFTKNVHKIEIENNKVRGEVVVYPYVLCVKPIIGYKCADIHPEYSANSFRFEEGEVLAVDEPQSVYVERELFKPVSSVFEMVVSESLSGFDWLLSFDDGNAQILVSEEAKEIIDSARNSTRNKAVLINSIYFSAVTQAISLLKEDPFEYEGIKWADVILKQCHNMSIDLQKHEAYYIAQRLLKSPFKLIYQHLFKEEL